MSRCFPFPPPGYELKFRPNDVDVIIKEKENHKKHKDRKEKKEKSERKIKERGEDKHKDKKDKKRKREKHRDKKDKNKDKPSSSGEKKSVGPLENQNDQKIVPDSTPTDRIQDERTVIELGNRFKNDGATGIQMVQKITILEKEKGFLAKVRENGNGRLVIKDQRDHSGISNCQSLQVDSRSLGNGRNSYGENQIKVEGKERNGYGKTVDAGGGDAIKNADQSKNTKAEDKKGKKEKKKELTGFRNDEVKLETSNGNFLDFHSNIPSDLLKENSDCQGKLPKLKELNGFLHAKYSEVLPNNMSRQAIASHQAGQTGNGFCPSQNAINEVGNRAVITDPKVNGKLSSPQSVIDNVRNIGPCRTAADNTKTENGKVTIHNSVVSNVVISPHIVRIQRMEPCQTSNGVVMANQIANSSIDGKAPPSHPLVENGGKVAVQTPDKMMHMKESGTNGSLDGKKHSSSMPSSASLKRKEKITTTKPPHPDMKYLSQILAVPAVEWPQSDDDQEWLFERQDSETKRPRTVSPETEQVWSEAVHLKSADVTALPYVIRY